MIEETEAGARMVSAQDQGPSDMNSLPWGSISVAYMFGLFVTFLQAAPEALDRCYQFSYCTSLVMENVAWSLVWPAYWLMS